MYILPVHHILEVLSHQIQSPHYSALQFCAYFPAPAMHMEKVLPSPGQISDNTVLPRSAYDFHRTAFCLSADRAKCHEAFHPLHKYNERHWSPQAQYRYPAKDAEAPYLHASVPACHDPAALKRNFPFQKSAHSEELLFYPLHKILYLKISVLLRQDRRLKQ